MESIDSYLGVVVHLGKISHGVYPERAEGFESKWFLSVVIPRVARNLSLNIETLGRLKLNPRAPFRFEVVFIPHKALQKRARSATQNFYHVLVFVLAATNTNTCSRARSLNLAFQNFQSV
jgi:hypothetical protein